MLRTVCTRAKAHGLKESRPTIRRDEDQGIGYSEGFEKSRHIISIALLVKLQRSRKDLYKAVEGPSTLSILPLMITGSGHISMSNAFNYFQV